MTWAPSQAEQRRTREAITRLHKRWKPLRPHKEQSRLWRSRARMKAIYAGRRSGKSEIAKRDGALEAFSNTRTFDDYPFWVVFGGPTRPQMKNLYWRELTSNLIPEEFIDRVDETLMTMQLWNGSEISVMSLEKAPRLEGRPIDRLRCDEFAEVKPRIWQVNLRPALDTDDREGDAWIYGVPRGGRGGHFFQTVREFLDPANTNADAFHWKSSDILPAHVIEQAKKDLDPLTYAQEYEADFTTFAGRAYHQYSYEVHSREALEYDPRLPLLFLYDFNRKPGIAAVAQEQVYRGGRSDVATVITAIIDEVWIPSDSNTRRVCEALIAKYGPDGLDHRQEVRHYGDATGGIKGHTVPYEGTDWDEIEILMARAFGERSKVYVGRTNPYERVRVNTVNWRLRDADGIVRMLVCPVGARHTCEDFDSVTVLEGTTGDLDKERDKMITHLSDAVGYYLAEEHPGHGGASFVEHDDYT